MLLFNSLFLSFTAKLDSDRLACDLYLSMKQRCKVQHNCQPTCFAHFDQVKQFYFIVDSCVHLHEYVT